ncbi:MAG: type II toxin-antitoxin system VapC family toxin [Acidobacteria bacterium]|nr:type II toxin-antitoxin system VapC family toxin [Acidobacteriota bacterium]
MRALLDTNAYSALKRGHPDVSDLVRRSDEVLVPVVVAGELLYGFRCGSRFERNRQDFEAFIASPFVKVVPVTLDTADRFGRIAATLRARGKPIPTNDIWVAAQAMETGAELLSFDRHYEAVDGLAWRLLS